MLLLIALTVVCSITYTVEIMFGLAGTVLMLLALTSFFPAKTLVIYSCLPQILVGTIGLIRSPRTVELGYLLRMLAFASAGSLLGLWLFYSFSAALFHILLASAISLFGLYLVAFPSRLRLGPVTRRVLDTCAGVSQALFGISGPIAMTRLLGTFDDKTVVRNYALAFFLALNLFRAGGYIVNQTLTPQIQQMMLVSGPVLAVVLWYSNQLHFRLNEAVFRRVVAWIVLLGGLSLFVHTDTGSLNDQGNDQGALRFLRHRAATT